MSIMDLSKVISKARKAAQGSHTPCGPITWVWGKDDLKALLQAIHGASEVVMDLETTGLDEHAEAGGATNGGYPARIVLAALTLPSADRVAAGAYYWRTFDGGQPMTYLVPLSHPASPLLGSWRKVMAIIGREIRRSGRPFVNANIKFDARWVFAQAGVDLSDSIEWDTTVSSQLVDTEARTRLKIRAARDFGIEEWDDFDLSTPGAAEQVDLIQLGEYAARDTYYTWKIEQEHRDQLFLTGDEEPFDSDDIQMARLGKVATYVAMPTVKTLTKVEQRGFLLDVDWVHDKIKEMDAQRLGACQDILGLYGTEPAPAPAKDGVTTAATSKWFQGFVAQAIEAGDLRVTARTDSGNAQWNKAVLIAQQRQGSPAADALLRHRDAVKTLEFLRSWLELKGPRNAIHATYNVGFVKTGRLSSCVSPDTLIDMPRDMVKYPDGVPMREVKAGDWVYSYDHHCRLTLRQVEWVGPTKTAETIIVTFENSQGNQRTLQCTPEHLVRLYNGHYCPAEYLMKGPRGAASPRVLGMVRRQWTGSESKKDRYLSFFPNSNSRKTPPSVAEGVRYGSTAGGKSKEHRWIMQRVLGKRLSTKWDVHHVDGVKVNNSPANLKYLPHSEHMSLTMRDRQANGSPDQPYPDVFTGKTDWRPVSIEPGPVIEVWDMTVPEDHCFIANGITVHNSNPNVQQISSRLKPAFIPRPGYVLLDLDYSQVELRVAAFISRSAPMIEAFQRGDDLHRLLAAKMANKAPEDVTPLERKRAKAGNFGLLYGMSPGGFQTYAATAYDVAMTLDEAQAVHAAFFEMWDGMRQWHERAKRRAYERGYVTSPIGRTQWLSDLYSKSAFKASHAERNALNSPVQGFGSDLMQMAAASIMGTLPGYPLPRVEGAHVVATVHDEICIEAPEDRWQEILVECKRRMEDVNTFLRPLDCQMDVPIVAGPSAGTRWGVHDLHDEDDPLPVV
ncbi:MAG: HNH endonuclease [Thermobifida sp.]|nr:HNH endonuclease [Thermobifida sp.]